MGKDYSAPEYHKSAFNCPHCNVFAHHTWQQLYEGSQDGGGVQRVNDLLIISGNTSICSHCKNHTFWVTLGDNMKNMIYPNYSNAPMPADDMPDDIEADYMEARSIVQQSPRGASALLRLCLQKLAKHLGEKGKHINHDIASLVKKGLPVRIQQAMDSVRVIGNDAVHPGQIDLRDDVETATVLFKLINFIVEEMITKPKELDQFYDMLPQSKKDAIEERDGKSENRE